MKSKAAPVYPFLPLIQEGRVTEVVNGQLTKLWFFPAG